MFKGTIAILAVGVFSVSSYAEQDMQNSGKRRPPREAVEACKSMNSGDSCSFEGRRGSVKGSCFSPSEELPLACRPADHRN